MAYYNKIGLLVLSEDRTKFLVCEPGKKYKERGVTQYLMPGGKFEEESDIECLKAEIKEELDCGVDVASLSLIIAAAVGHDVTIRLYQGKLIGAPRPSTEIGALHWIGKEKQMNQEVSPIIRNELPHRRAVRYHHLRSQKSLPCFLPASSWL